MALAFVTLQAAREPWRWADRHVTVLQFGFLQQHSSGNYSVRLGARRELVSHTARANRSMELSDVAFWRNKLYAVCDFTGATCVLFDGFYIYVVLGCA